MAFHLITHSRTIGRTIPIYIGAVLLLVVSVEVDAQSRPITTDPGSHVRFGPRTSDPEQRHFELARVRQRYGKMAEARLQKAGRQISAAGTEKAEVTLAFWHIMNYEGPREVLAAAVKRFEAAHPTVKVNVQTFENDAYKTKLSIEMNSGTPPDVFFTWGGGGLATFAKAGKVVDLTDGVNRGGWRERLLQVPLDFCSYKGRVYAVPVDLACVPVWYNSDLFAEHGLTPPRTFAELLAVCRKFRAEGITPIALGNKKQWPGAFLFIYLATRSGGSQLFLDAAARKPGAAFDDPAFVNAGKRLQELINAKAFSVGFNGIDTGHARTQFLNGEAAMYVMGTWLVARVKKEGKDFLPKMKCFSFPAIADGKGDPTTIAGGVNCGFAVSSTCRNPKQAVELLRFLTDEKVGEEWCRIGRIPALRVKDEALVRLPAATCAALDLLKKAKRMQPYYDQYLLPRLAEEHKKTTQGLFARTITPREAAQRMEKLAQELARQSPK